VKINTNIQLTPQEQELFSILNNVVKEKAPSTTLRAAGGWVRDKLIGIPADDIDIMVDNMSGEDFAYLVTHYLGSKDPHIIKENPTKSKHVETAKANIPLSDGSTQEIDFARARKEIYEDGSRIPTIQPATPQEDAMRRDLTINSMFYNLSTRQIEDLTGKGLKDMVSDTIRTPINPLKTFSDDPLRIFRVIRFSAKYNGNIDPETLKAMQDPSLINAINQKVSKERIGQEFTKMLKNPNPQVAIKLLKDTGLFQNIISEALKGTKYEGKMGLLDMEQNNPWHELTVWGHTMQVVKYVLDKYDDADGEQKITMILASLMHDMGKLFTDIQAESTSHPGRTSYHGHEKESEEISQHILKYLKMEPFIKQVSGLARYHMQPHRLSDEDNIKAMRKFVRRMGEQSLNWLDVFNMAAADAMSKSETIDPAVVQKYKNFENKLQEAFLSLKPIEGKSAIAPILNGNEIMKILNIKGGAWMAGITEFVKEMRDENPDITKEEATQLLLAKYPPNPPENTSTPPPYGMSQSSNVTAKGTGEENENISCSQHLFNSKREKMNELLKEKHYYEVFSVVREIKNEFPNDEKIVKLIAHFMFELLLESVEYRNAEILQHIFTKAEDNFFDTVLCSYVFGILVLLETETEKEIIEQIGERMTKMAPGFLKTVIKKLPKDVFHPDLKKKFESSK